MSDALVKQRAEIMKKVIEQQRMIAEKMKKVRYKLVILSGKGGVGKSFVTASLAMALAMKGRRVAVFDADVHGPSIPKMLGVHGKRMYALPDGRLLPVEGPLGVKVVSIDFLLESEEQAVIWRGPLKTAAIRELLAYTDWGELDYLLVDLPPGTGDEQLTIAQLIPGLSGTIIVTIPSDVARIVVKKAITFAKRLNIPIVGVIENMSYFECPDGSRHYIFGKGAGRRIAEEMGVPFLGEIPIDPRISKANDEGKPFFVEYPDSSAAKAFLEIAERVIERVEGKGEGRSESQAKE
ncbi:Mrp/NBP35 family ATP-binding protein [Pyrolobus fumarii]|uniref:Mrp/NBP35 family ATP-binding protein n=1 Tax=Pyrolobus fumarii TaxID=54252 RepID=UPI001FCBD33E|nr:Mrp/NBP35 family ATP-binding protein [Pyrolobus fumarii]